MSQAGPVARARLPQPLWEIVPVAARARLLRRLAQALLDEVDPLADALAAAGVPRTEALLAELLPAIGGLHALAGEGPAALAEQRLGGGRLRRIGRRTTLIPAPVGVVGIRGGPASPWAEPLLETAAAVLAGNAVVLAMPVPAAAARLGSALARAGMPDDLVVLAAEDDLAGCDAVLDTEPPRARSVMLVLEGAPLGRTVDGALWAAFARAGRGPAAVGTVLAVAPMADELTARLERAARALRVGDPADPRTEVGPLASEADAEAVEAFVRDAVAAGAEVRCGGRLDGRRFAPLVMAGVPADARVLHEPVPGPVLGVVAVASEADAVAAAAGAGTVSVWTGDRAHGERVARAVGAEQAWVNDHGAASPAPPVRIGRHVRPRQLGSQPAGLRSARWLPYDPVLAGASIAAARFVHGRRSERAAVLREGALPLARIGLRLTRDALRR